MGFFSDHRRDDLRAQPFPDEWRAIVERTVPLYAKLTDEQRRELEGHVQVLLAEKHWEGAGGLELTDEIRLTIAAHAALLLLGRETDFYPGLVTIIVYPEAYEAPVEREEGGIVSAYDEARLGESWQRGVVVLAWDAARAGARDARDGENVILHEFAHQLDTEDGIADGTPRLAHRADYAGWARALQPEFEALREKPHKSRVLDPYGAENPAEFFAVATEAYFEKPDQLRRRHPEMYEELRDFFRVDLATPLPDEPPDLKPVHRKEPESTEDGIPTDGHGNDTERAG